MTDPSDAKRQPRFPPKPIGLPVTSTFGLQRPRTSNDTLHEITTYFLRENIFGYFHLYELFQRKLSQGNQAPTISTIYLMASPPLQCPSICKQWYGKRSAVIIWLATLFAIPSELLAAQRLIHIKVHQHQADLCAQHKLSIRDQVYTLGTAAIAHPRTTRFSNLARVCMQSDGQVIAHRVIEVAKVLGSILI